MKMLVMTNKHGKVIGTARMPESKDANTPYGGRPVVGDGGQTHEVVLPPELYHVTSATELHREVSKLIRSKT
jgi:hypothetical protein